MWIVIKIDKKNQNIFKRELSLKLPTQTLFYSPKILVSKHYNNKIIKKEFDILGDYIFCYNSKFSNYTNLNLIKFTRGLKNILSGYISSQNEIVFFVEKCKKMEDKKGYVSQSFFELSNNSYYKFSSGPFVNEIFKILKIQKTKLEVLLGNIKMSLNKKDFLFERA